MSPPLLSLAVIVKNQAGLLSRLLREHRSLYDEAIVVDTGSTDDSVARAKEQGARVISCQWRQDFSAPRNLSLAASTGRWVLVLDCDEIISHSDQLWLRRHLELVEPCLMVLGQRNYTDRKDLLGFVPLGAQSGSEESGRASGYVLRQQIRIFPNGFGLRYAGKIHETLEKSCLETSLQRTYLEAVVHHYGHLEAREADPYRICRNGDILRREISSAPGNPVLMTEFAEQLVAEGNIPGAVKICQEALTRAPGHPQLYRARLMLARMLAYEAPKRALAEVEQALAERPDVPECWAEVVRMNLVQRHQPRAAGVLKEAVKVFPLDPVLGELTTQVLRQSVDNQIAGSG